MPSARLTCCGEILSPGKVGSAQFPQGFEVSISLLFFLWSNSLKSFSIALKNLFSQVFLKLRGGSFRDAFKFLFSQWGH